MEAVSGYQGWALVRGAFVSPNWTDGGLAMRCRVLGMVMAVVVLAGCTGAGDEPGQTDNDPTAPVDMGTPATSEPRNPGQTVEP